MKFRLPPFNFIPYRRTAPGTEIFVLFPVGEDEKESLSHGGRHLATGAKEGGRLEVLVVCLARHL